VRPALFAIVAETDALPPFTHDAHRLFVIVTEPTNVLFNLILLFVVNVPVPTPVGPASNRYEVLFVYTVRPPVVLAPII